MSVEPGGQPPLVLGTNHYAYFPPSFAHRHAPPRPVRPLPRSLPAEAMRRAAAACARRRRRPAGQRTDM